MSLGNSCCSEPRPTWREKLSHSLFGSHADTSISTLDTESPKILLHTSQDDLETSRIGANSTTSVSPTSMKVIPLSSNRPIPTRSSTSPSTSTQSRIDATPVFAPSTSSSPEVLYDSNPASGSGGILSSRHEAMKLNETSKDPEGKTTSRRKQLSTIFSAWMPTSSQNGSDRPGSRSAVPLRRAGENDSSTYGMDSEPARSPSSLSNSITQGIKSLQQRHRLNREAVETFKTMKIEEGDNSPSEERRSSSESVTNPEMKASEKRIIDLYANNDIPEEMIQGEMMLKVTPKKVKQRLFRLDSDRGQIYWESKRNNKVNLESIREVRTGPAAASYRSSMSISSSHEARWISIIYQTEGIYKAIHLIALSDEAFRRWTETLSAVQNERSMLMSGIDFLDQRQQLWLRQHWKAADSSQDSRLDFVEVTKLCRRLGILSNVKDLLNRFQQADTSKKGYLNYEDFQHFVTLLKRRMDLEAIFMQWADVDVNYETLHKFDCSSEEGMEVTRENLHKVVEQAGISRTRLHDFLMKEQGFITAVKAAEAVDLIMTRYGQDNALEIAGFASFLMSSDNAILTDQSPLSSVNVASSMKERGKAQTTDELIAVSSLEKTTQDMTRPLSEYFISSSHNTYLVGGQWKGDSTVEGYIRALMQGARSVEIDCWNGPANEPQVTHGRTLTTKVPFRDVIIAIERYAFAVSPFPLILSLEVHNDVVQQEALATILREVLGDKLLSAPLSRTEEELQTLPSPQELKGKILVKAKNLLVPETVRSASDEATDGVPLVMAEKRSSTWTTDTTESESDHILQSARGLVRSVTKRKTERQSEADSKGQTSKVLISPLLASLLIYTVGVKHRGINKKEYYAVEHMISLSERSGIKYLKSDINCEDLIKHNRNHLTRVYPSMSSFKRLSQSANFLPSLFWCMGCQLVAINWQTLDAGYEMNQAMFSRNAKAGYVLKPEAMRFKEIGKSNVRKQTTVQVSIRIISAQQLPRFRDASRDRELDDNDVVDPFVSLCIVVPQHRDYSVRRVKTSSSRNTRKSQSGIQSLFATAGVGVERNAASVVSSSSLSTMVLKDSIPLSPSGSSYNNKNTKRHWLCRQKTSVVQANGFNPIWNETLTFSITFENARLGAATPSSNSAETDDNHSIQAYTRGLLDLCFLRFEVGEKVKMSINRSGTILDDINGDSISSERGDSEDEETLSASDDETDNVTLESLGEGTHCLATHMISLGSLARGYRHVPLYDAQLSQYLFSTLFIKTDIQLV